MAENNIEIRNVNEGKTGDVRIPGALKPVDAQNVAAFTGDIYDDRLEDNQRNINKRFNDYIENGGGDGQTVVSNKVPYFRKDGWSTDLLYGPSSTLSQNSVNIGTILPSEYNKYNSEINDVPLGSVNSTPTHYIKLKNSVQENTNYPTANDGYTMVVREGDVLCFRSPNNKHNSNYKVKFIFKSEQGAIVTDTLDPRDEPMGTDSLLTYRNSGTLPIFVVVPASAKFVQILLYIDDFSNISDPFVYQVGGAGISRVITALTQDRYLKGRNLYDIFNFNETDFSFGFQWRGTNINYDSSTESHPLYSQRYTVDGNGNFHAELDGMFIKENSIYKVIITSGTATQNDKIIDINNLKFGIGRTDTDDYVYYGVKEINNDNLIFVYDENYNDGKIHSFNLPTTQSDSFTQISGRRSSYAKVIIEGKFNSLTNGNGYNIRFVEASVEDKIVDLYKLVEVLKNQSNNQESSDLTQINNSITNINNTLSKAVPQEDIEIYKIGVAGYEHTINISDNRNIFDQDDYYKLKIIPNGKSTPEFYYNIYEKVGNTTKLLFNGIDTKRANTCEVFKTNLKNKSIYIKFSRSWNVQIVLLKCGIKKTIEQFYDNVLNTQSKEVTLEFNNSTTATKTISINKFTNGGAYVSDAKDSTAYNLLKVDILKYNNLTNEYETPNNDEYSCNIKVLVQTGSSTAAQFDGILEEANVINNGYFYIGRTFTRKQIEFTVTKTQASNDLIKIVISKLSTFEYLKYLNDKIQAINGNLGNQESLALSSGNLVVLNNDNTLQEQITIQNTTYEIRHNFSLTGTLSIPNNCTLLFKGGSISGGTITLNNVFVDGKPSFNSCSFSGQFLNTDVYFKWFNPSTSVNDDNKDLLETAISCCRENLMIETIYPLANTVTINKRITVKGVSDCQGIYANMTQGATQGFRMTAAKTAFTFGTNGSLSIYNIAVIGIKNLYTGGNPRLNTGIHGTFTDTDQNGTSYSISVVTTEGGVSIAAFELPLHGNISLMRDCAICGFTYGIRAVGGYIDRLENNYFSACRYGLYCFGYTSDMMISNNKFNTCLNDCNYKSISYNGATTDISNNAEYLKEIGAGVYLRGSGMVQLNNNRFEFNFIQIVLDEANVGVQIQNNMFDKATAAHILIYNGTDSAILSQDPDDRERFQPAFSGILFDGNTFLRGANIQSGSGSVQTFNSVAGEAIFYIKNSEEAQNSQFTEENGYSTDRGCILTLNNNTVTDFIEVDKSITADNINYPQQIFKILNGGEGLIINSNANDFTNSKASNIVTFILGSSGKVYFNDNGSNFGSLSHSQWNDILVLRKIEINGNNLIIYNSQSDGDIISQDIIIDLTNIGSGSGGSSEGGGTNVNLSNIYTKTEVDNLLSNLVLDSGSNPFATGTIVLINGTETNLSSLLSQQNKFFLIKGNIDLQSSNFTTAQGSYYYFMGSTMSNCGNVYINNNSTIDGCKFNGFKEIVLGTNAVLKNCDCDGLLHSRGVWVDGDGARVLNNNIYNITDYEYQGSLLTTAAIRSHRYTHRAVTDGVYIKNVQIKGNTLWNVKPKPAGASGGYTNKLACIYLNEVYAEISNNTIIGFGDPDRLVQGTTDQDIDGIHMLADVRYTDWLAGNANPSSNQTFTEPWGWHNGEELSRIGSPGTDAPFKQVLTIIRNNTFRDCTFVKSLFKTQASDVTIEGNFASWNTIAEQETRNRCYSSVRVLGASNVNVLNNVFYMPKVPVGTADKMCYCVRGSLFDNLVVRGNVWTYSCPDKSDIVTGPNSAQDFYDSGDWNFYDSQFQLGWHLEFTNNKMYVKNRSNVLSWQSIHYARIANNYFYITDNNPSSNLLGTYDNISVNGYDPTVFGGDVLFENNYIHCKYITRTNTNGYTNIALSQTMKIIMKNNYIKTNQGKIRLKLYNITGLEAVFDNNIFDGGDGYIYCATNTGNIGAQGNATVPSTWQIISSIDIRNMDLYKIDIHDVSNLYLRNVKLLANNEPITLKNVSTVKVLYCDLESVPRNNYLCKITEGASNIYIDSHLNSTIVNKTGNSSNVSVSIKNAPISGTTANRPSNVLTGHVYFDTTENKVYLWNGTQWVSLSNTSSGDDPGTGGGGSEDPGTGGGGSEDPGTGPIVQGQSRLAIKESLSPIWDAPDSTDEIDAILDEGCYVLDEENSKMAKLDSTNHTKFADGTSWDGTYGNAFRHIPTIYYKIDNGNLIMSRTSFTDCKTLPETWIGLYQGYVDSENKLRSIPNVVTTGNKTITEFWSAAQEVGQNYGIMSYTDQQAIVFLYLMKYHNTNFENFSGITDIHLTNLNTFTTGFTASLGDNGGTIAYDNTATTINSLFGIEGLVSSRLEFRQNIGFDTENNLVVIYSGNTLNVDASNILRTFDNSPVPNGKYIKELYWGENGDIIPKSQQEAAAGTAKNQYYCDCGYTHDGAVCVQGSFYQIRNGGGIFFIGSDPITVKAANYGARLCYKSTALTLVTGSELAALNA